MAANLDHMPLSPPFLISSYDMGMVAFYIKYSNILEDISMVIRFTLKS